MATVGDSAPATRSGLATPPSLSPVRDTVAGEHDARRLPSLSVTTTTSASIVDTLPPTTTSDRDAVAHESLSLIKARTSQRRRRSRPATLSTPGFPSQNAHSRATTADFDMTAAGSLASPTHTESAAATRPASPSDTTLAASFPTHLMGDDVDGPIRRYARETLYKLGRPLRGCAPPAGLEVGETQTVAPPPLSEEENNGVSIIGNRERRRSVTGHHEGSGAMAAPSHGKLPTRAKTVNRVAIYLCDPEDHANMHAGQPHSRRESVASLSGSGRAAPGAGGGGRRRSATSNAATAAALASSLWSLSQAFEQLQLASPMRTEQLGSSDLEEGEIPTARPHQRGVTVGTSGTSWRSAGAPPATMQSRGVPRHTGRDRSVTANSAAVNALDSPLASPTWPASPSTMTATSAMGAPHDPLEGYRTLLPDHLLRAATRSMSPTHATHPALPVRGKLAVLDPVTAMTRDERAELEANLAHLAKLAPFGGVGAPPGRIGVFPGLPLSPVAPTSGVNSGSSAHRRTSTLPERSVPAREKYHSGTAPLLSGGSGAGDELPRRSSPTQMTGTHTASSSPTTSSRLPPPERLAGPPGEGFPSSLDVPATATRAKGTPPLMATTVGLTMPPPLVQSSPHSGAGSTSSERLHARRKAPSPPSMLPLSGASRNGSPALAPLRTPSTAGPPLSATATPYGAGTPPPPHHQHIPSHHQQQPPQPGYSPLNVKSPYGFGEQSPYNAAMYPPHPVMGGSIIPAPYSPVRSASGSGMAGSPISPITMYHHQHPQHPEPVVVVEHQHPPATASTATTALDLPDSKKVLESYFRESNEAGLTEYLSWLTMLHPVAMRSFIKTLVTVGIKLKAREMTVGALYHALRGGFCVVRDVMETLSTLDIGVLNLINNGTIDAIAFVLASFLKDGVVSPVEVEWLFQQYHAVDGDSAQRLAGVLCASLAELLPPPELLAVVGMLNMRQLFGVPSVAKVALHLSSWLEPALVQSILRACTGSGASNGSHPPPVMTTPTAAAM